MAPWKQLDDPDGRHVVWTVETSDEDEFEDNEPQPDLELAIHTGKPQKSLVRALVEAFGALALFVVAIVLASILLMGAGWLLAQVFVHLFR